MSRAALGFDESGSEDDSDDKPQLTSRQKLQEQKKSVNKHIIQQQQKKPFISSVEEEDPSVYEYDEVYETIQKSRNAKLRKMGGGDQGKKKQGAQYMNSLLEAKKKREADKLRVQELKIQNERELEGDEFKGKEEFVTAGYKVYREKMLRVEKEEEENDKQYDIKEFPHESKLDSDNNDYIGKDKQGETKNTLDRIGEVQNNTTVEEHKPKTRLLPRLPESEIEAARERYLQRKAKARAAL